MSGNAKGTFTPLHQILPDPNEPDWILPNDILSSEEIEVSNQSRFGEGDNSAMDRHSLQTGSAQKDQMQVALTRIASAIDGQISNLNHQGSKLFENSDYAAALERAEQGKILAQFRGKVQALIENWISISESVELNGLVDVKANIPTSKRGRPKKMSVTFGDGTTISEGTAAEIFAKSIAKVGLQKVLSLGIEKSGRPILDGTRSEKLRPGDYKQVDGYYLATFFNAEDKRTILKQIGELTGTSLEVSIEQQ